MSSTNKTTNLELSQFLGSDSPKWLTDYNADMEKIDAGYQTVKAQADATDLIVGGHTSSISTLQDTTTSQGTAITGLRTDVNGNSGSINTINELLGSGEPTTTNKTIIGAINEIQTEVVAITPVASKSFKRYGHNLIVSGSTTYAQMVVNAINYLIDTVRPTLGSNEIITNISMYAPTYGWCNTSNNATISPSDTDVRVDLSSTSYNGTNEQLIFKTIEATKSTATMKKVSVTLPAGTFTVDDISQTAITSGTFAVQYDIKKLEYLS